MNGLSGGIAISPTEKGDYGGNFGEELGIIDKKDVFKKRPTLIEGRYKKSFIKLLGNNLPEGTQGNKIFFWPSNLDPDLSPETWTDNGEFKIELILLSDGSVGRIGEKPKTSKDYSEYNDLHKMPPSEFLEATGLEAYDEDIGIDIEGTAEQIELIEIESEYIKEDIPPETKKQPEDDPIQISKLIEQYPKNTIVCLVGFGDKDIGETIYKGTHILQIDKDFDADFEPKEPNREEYISQIHESARKLRDLLGIREN